MRPLFDLRQPAPMLFALMVHGAALWMLQAGLRQPAIVTPEVKEVMAFLVPPQPKPMQPAPVPKPMPAPEPPPVVSEPPRPPEPVKQRPPKPPRPKPEKKVSKTPSEKAVQVREKEVPAVTTPVETPVPAAPTAPPVPPVASAPVPAPSPAAPPAPAPPAVEAPRFDAAYLKNPAPAYPPLSRRMGEEGRVVLRVQVSASGSAEEVRIHSSSGFPRLDDAASAAVQGWRFVPATQAGKPVSAWVLVPLNFRLDQ